jgi:hypothetical protein
MLCVDGGTATTSGWREKTRPGCVRYRMATQQEMVIASPGIEIVRGMRPVQPLLERAPVIVVPG